MDIYKNWEVMYILRSIAERFIEDFYKGMT